MALELLSNLEGWKLEDEDQDVRGRSVRSPDGRQIGRVDGLLANTETRHVEAIVLDSGAKIPIENVDLDGNEVVALANNASDGIATPRDGSARDRREFRIPVIEEHVQMDKRSVIDSGVRVQAEEKVIPVEEDVILRRTDVTVERLPADRPATERDFAAAKEGVEAIESHEEPVVTRDARVVGEVVVTQSESATKETVKDTARRIEPEVENAKNKNRPSQDRR